MVDNILNIRSAEETKWDCASFGEVMLRFDPGFGRVRNSRQFNVWEGGGEYNVARAFNKCWGKPSDIGGAAVFLASSASDYVNGAIIPVDGGWLAR